MPTHETVKNTVPSFRSWFFSCNGLRLGQNYCGKNNFIGRYRFDMVFVAVVRWPPSFGPVFGDFWGKNTTFDEPFCTVFSISVATSLYAFNRTFHELSSVWVHNFPVITNLFLATHRIRLFHQNRPKKSRPAAVIRKAKRQKWLKCGSNSQKDRVFAKES